ncbi:hypothetical protein [Stenomitos frigidus]|uniref:Uncharacterized protein n=1 Tax=Stenomitos frigidus ULC18 TaxID=2107698 RepID=A0A2T1DSX4_9CYAN|nr:hypothetical protein [Stenomitos frigidus]PSB23588.1 hypothetical protein C7B82_30360 [Stenomitos frigidus ULC18]
MPRPKRNSRVLAKSERQLESLQSIERMLDFGNGVTAQAYADVIDQMRQRLAYYNTLLSTVDDAQRDVELTEQALTDLSKRLMVNVAARYGEDSREYRMAGGKPRSTGRRSTSRSTTNMLPPTPVTESSASIVQNGTRVTA